MDSITQADREAAESAFNDVLGDAGSYAEYGSPSYREGGVRTLSQAFAAHRRTAHAQGMIEAARICGSLAETTYDDAEGFVAATGCEAAIMRAASALATKGKANGG